MGRNDTDTTTSADTGTDTDADTAGAAPPLLLFVLGPPAVGKMSVGQAVAERTGLRLFHNHLSIELALRYFDYGTPAFHRINGSIRRQVVREVAASDLPGLVFTFVWAFDEPEDAATVEEYARPFRERGGRVLFVELEASQDERLRRNEGVSRLAEKPSKRDLESSRTGLLAMDARYRMNSGGAFDDREDWLRIDNTHLTPGAVAEHVIRHHRLPAACAETGPFDDAGERAHDAEGPGHGVRTR